MTREAGRGGFSTRTQLIKRMNELMPELDIDALWLLWLRTTNVKRQGEVPVMFGGARKRAGMIRKKSKHRVEARSKETKAKQ